MGSYVPTYVCAIKQEVSRMDFLLRSYKQLFTPLAKDNGFKPSGKSFYRLKDDIVQWFVINKSHKGTCTIELNALPFCWPVNRTSLTGGRRMGDFLGLDRWWDYDPRCDESKLLAVEGMFVVTRDLLLPALDRAVDAASVYALLCENDMRRSGEVRSGEVKVALSTKMGDYSTAVEHLRSMEKHSVTVFAHNMSRNDPYFLPDPKEREAYISRHNEYIAGLRHQIECLSIPDMDYINDYITTNEEQTRINFGMKKE